MDLQYDVIIIGAGPSGLTAGIYATRAGLKTAIIESSSPGGKMVKTFEIQNWPGVKMTNGADLAYQFYDHATSLGASYLYGDVVDIIDHQTHKEVVSKTNNYTCKAVIIATGTVERLLNINNEAKYTGRGVSYCAVCDASFFKDKIVTVIGGGNSALEESLYLTQFAKKVRIVIRRDVFRAEEKVQSQVINHEKIEIIRDSIPVDIIGNDQHVTQIVLENVKTKEQTTIDTDGIFPYIGADPATSFVHFPIKNDLGYMLVNEKMETAIKGIYASGDVCQKVLRQVVTATNDGAIAAQSAFHFINEEKKI